MKSSISKGENLNISSEFEVNAASQVHIQTSGTEDTCHVDESLGKLRKCKLEDSLREHLIRYNGNSFREFRDPPAQGLNMVIAY